MRQEVIIKDGFTLSPDGTNLVKGCDVEECHIPQGVKVVGENSFKECRNVRKVIIPSSVEVIEARAFVFSDIETMHIPKSVKRIGEKAFYFCDNLKSVTFENGLSNLGNAVFMLCDHLESVHLPNTLKNIPDECFWGCVSLNDIKLPDGLVSIGFRAFADCRLLSPLELPSPVIGLYDQAFSGCECLDYFVIPEGVTVLSYLCFSHCIQLERVKIPTTLQQIDRDVFLCCNDLTLEVPRGTADHYKELELQGVSHIIEYDCPAATNIDKAKKLSRIFLKARKAKMAERKALYGESYYEKDYEMSDEEDSNTIWAKSIFDKYDTEYNGCEN